MAIETITTDEETVEGKHAKKYHEFPTLQLLITIVKDDLKGDVDTSLRDQVIDYLQRMKQNPDPGDLPFIKEKSLDFCKKQALKEALEKNYRSCCY